MKKKNSLIIASVALLTLFAQAKALGAKKIYNYPSITLKEYTSAQYIYYPNGDIDDKRAFYWGRVIGCDGLGFTIRYLFPHIIECNWQEKVYNNQTEKDYIFDLVKDFQDTYAAYGCDDNYMKFHTHHPLYGETISQWRADIITGMTQKAELALYAGVDRILLDNEYTDWDLVPDDVYFWYDLGTDIIAAVRGVSPDIKLGFYPGLQNYWLTLTEPGERVNPKAIGTYPGETSIPEDRRNMRHGLYQGIYDNLNGSTMWEFAASYSSAHMCIGAYGASYVFNLEERYNWLQTVNLTMLGAGIEHMIVKGDLSSRQPNPIAYHCKQPNLSLMMQKRNYDLIFGTFTDLAGSWDFGGSWDEDGSSYLTYPSIPDFINAIDDIQLNNTELPPPETFTFSTPYKYDTITGQEHHISVAVDADISEKLSWFNLYGGAGGYHVTGKHVDSFPDYVNTRIVSAGKDEITIPLRDSDEYSWAREYRAKGFFKNHEVVYTPDDPSQYGCLRPSQCAVDRASDINKDCEVNIVDFAMMATTWLQCSHPNDENCE